LDQRTDSQAGRGQGAREGGARRREGGRGRGKRGTGPKRQKGDPGKRHVKADPENAKEQNKNPQRIKFRAYASSF